MEKKTYELTFITPCFCTGANQTEAEIRPASIRGALRWWFRLIGGTAQQEINVFGGIAGDENTASNLVIRVSDIKEGNSIYPTANNKFFTKNINPLQKSQSFTIIALLKKPKSLHLTEKLLLEKTLELFSVLGCLGRRANRGCGAIIPQEPISNEKLKKIISYAPKMLALKSSQTFNTAKETMEFLEETTKELRKRLRSDNGFIDAFGGINPGRGVSADRQSSGYKYKPLLIDGKYHAVIHYTDEFLDPAVNSIKSELEKLSGFTKL